MKDRALVCDFSGVYRAQGFLQWLQDSGACVKVLDLSRLEGTSCYCDADAEESIRANLPQQLPLLRWTDSGDYHYMTYILSGRETQPFHLLLLDNHPDNQAPAFGGVLSCGSWVSVMKQRNGMLRDVLWIGPESGKDYAEWMGRRRGERVYISLDKDVMSKEWARTDWSQGEYSLEQIDNILGLAFREMEVAAVDICGELSESKGATPQDLRINFETNTKLYNLICQN